jgi:hypothetical protein
MKPYWAKMRPDPKTIDMSHCNTELFSKYINWLYLKTIPMENVNSSNNKDFQSLAGAYVLGEELMDVNFKNAITDTILAHMLIEIPSPEMVKTIYDGTSEGSLGRRLMSDIYAYAAYADEKDVWHTAFERCSVDFLVDILKTMTKTRDRLSMTQRPWTISETAYHEREHNQT